MARVCFDLDQTLIDYGFFSWDQTKPDNAILVKNCLYIVKRPHAEELINYCIEHCEAVAVWTAAEPEWAETVLDLFPTLKAKAVFIWTKDNCEIEQDGFAEPAKAVKYLDQIWVQNEGWTQSNTVMIDDTQWRLKSNQIKIKPFDCLDTEDAELLDVIAQLKLYQEGS